MTHNHNPETVYPADSRTERKWRDLKAQLRSEAVTNPEQAKLFSYATSTSLEKR